MNSTEICKENGFQHRCPISTSKGITDTMGGGTHKAPSHIISIISMNKVMKLRNGFNVASIRFRNDS